MNASVNLNVFVFDDLFLNYHVPSGCSILSLRIESVKIRLALVSFI